MATTITGIVSNELVFDLSDYTGETAKVVIPLDGAATNADIIAIVDNYIALSNALPVPTIRRSYGFAGYDADGAATSAQLLLAAIFAMQFEKPNPLNALKQISKQILVPAYIDTLRNDGVRPHVAVTDNANLNALIALLEDNLNYLAVDGDLYPGGWTFNAGSKFGTKATVTDGY